MIPLLKSTHQRRRLIHRPDIRSPLQREIRQCSHYASWITPCGSDGSDSPGNNGKQRVVDHHSVVIRLRTQSAGLEMTCGHPAGPLTFRRGFRSFPLCCSIVRGRILICSPWPGFLIQTFKADVVPVSPQFDAVPLGGAGEPANQTPRLNNLSASIVATIWRLLGIVEFVGCCSPAWRKRD